MKIDFMQFEEEEELREVVGHHLKIGSATVEDVLLFCHENKLIIWGPTKIEPNFPPRMLNYEVMIGGKTRGSSGARDFFKLSNWKNILNVFQWWPALFSSVDWRIEFFFVKNLLSEINVVMTVTAF